MLNHFSDEQILAIVEENGACKENLLYILLKLQDLSPQNYIDERTANLVAERVGLSRVQMYDILTFYAMLKTKPRGKYIIEVCNSSPCYASKADRVTAILEKELGIKVGETTPDGMFTVSYMPCNGYCEIGPVIRVQGRTHGNLTEEKIKEIIDGLRNA
ncbi:MAG: NAD(P)H-dependent oxidoreductase subunit E [Oscillospiraceae bacterium]|nr:NAD(P)H-dependent oxidoreductase subunit E [Oscillospiraceae bacterium]